jgi:hypothetical protein
MQFAVPQFTDVEDKLIGPLTLKQFLVLLATGGLILFFYSILKLNVFFFFFAIPTGLVGILLAFGKFNGRPVLGYAPVFLTFLSKPRSRVFKREELNVSMTFKADKPQVAVQKVDDADQGRLRKLAYLLDQKTEEEKVLIDKETTRVNNKQQTNG